MKAYRNRHDKFISLSFYRFLVKDSKKNYNRREYTVIIQETESETERHGESEGEKRGRESVCEGEKEREGECV